MNLSPNLARDKNSLHYICSENEPKVQRGFPPTLERCCQFERPLVRGQLASEPSPFGSHQFDVRIIEFGYVGSTVVFAMYVWILLAGRRLIIETSPTRAAINIFPFSVVTVVMIINITEGLLMEKHITTVLTAMAAGLAFQVKRLPPADPARQRV